MASIKELLDIRKQMKLKKPDFIRQDIRKKARLKIKWRKPRGLDSKIRRKLNGRAKPVSQGYRSPKNVRGLHKRGLQQSIIRQTKNRKKREESRGRNQQGRQKRNGKEREGQTLDKKGDIKCSLRYKNGLRRRYFKLPGNKLGCDLI